MSWREFEVPDIEEVLGLPENQARVLHDLIELCNKHGINSSDLEEYLKDLRRLEELSCNWEDYGRQEEEHSFVYYGD